MSETASVACLESHRRRRNYFQREITAPNTSSSCNWFCAEPEWRERVAIVSPQSLSWKFTLNHSALPSDIPSEPSQFYHRCLEHVGKVIQWLCLPLFISTKPKVFSGRAGWYQTHPSPFQEVWQGCVLVVILLDSVIHLIRTSPELSLSMCNATASGRKTMLIIKAS